MSYCKNTKEYNYIKILKYVYENNEVLRKQIIEDLHMAPQTAIDLIKELKSMNYLKEEAVDKPSLGRTPSVLKINYSDFYLISIEISVNHCYCFISSLDSKLVDFSEVNIDSNLINNLKKTISHFIDKYSSLNFLSIVVSVEGVVDKDSGLILVSKDLGLTQTNLTNEFDVFELPVFVRNDVNLITYCKNIEDKSLTNSLVIKLDKGVGASLILDKRVLHDHGIYGELGHFSVIDNERKIKCRCGKVNCLTCFISQEGLAREYGKDFASFVCGYNNGEEKVLRILDNALDKLSFVLVNLITFLGLEKVFICGKSAYYFESHMFDYLNKEISKNLSHWIKFEGVFCEKVSPVYSLSGKFFIKYVLNHYQEYKKMIENCR